MGDMEPDWGRGKKIGDVDDISGGGGANVGHGDMEPDCGRGKLVM